MNLLNKLFLKNGQNHPLEQNFKHNIYTVETSQYSPLPRFYYINGVRYDIDSPASVSSIPVCETHFKINNEDWGIDTILREHVNRYYSHIPEELKSACYPKISEIEYAGLIIESSSEKQARIKQEKEQQKNEFKFKSISLSDMEQFHFSKFKMITPIYDNRMSIMPIDKENELQVKTEIHQINELVKRTCDTVNINEIFEINVNDLEFGTTLHIPENTKQYYTYFECVPYTNTRKLSKFPLILHYATSSYAEFNPVQNYFGTISYMQDENIGKCNLVYWKKNICYSFCFNLVGKTLTCKKIETSFNGTRTVLYKL